ncbi:hypothetical protein H6F61_26470 [Cyanobacteria bacterium FACHB-472]|nr:hypothetical protein [Cyanobacteria bacterium FACHB-472]
MPTANDALGVWNDLGTLYPTEGEWIKFPVQAVGGNDLVRISFIYPTDAIISSWSWLRCIYTTADVSPVSQAVKVYPKAVPMLINMPIFQDLRDREVTFRNFEILKMVRSSRYSGIVTDYLWGVKLEELWG